MATTHALKCWPKPFAAIRAGLKTFELRHNDRDFAVGDLIELREFDPETGDYTGQTETRLIQFIWSEAQHGIIHGFVAIGFGPVPHHEPISGPESVDKASVAQWHRTEASRASQRAQNARATATAYAGASEDVGAPSVGADRWTAVASAADAEARFHTGAAAAIEA